MTVNSGSKHQKEKTPIQMLGSVILKRHFLCSIARIKDVWPTLRGAILLFSQQLSGEARTDATVSCFLPLMLLSRVCRSHCTLVIALLTFPHYPQSKIQPWIILWRTADDNSKAQCYLFSTKKPPSFFLYVCLKTRMI